MDIYEAMDPDVYFALFGDRIRHIDEALLYIEQQPGIVYFFPDYVLLPGIKYPRGVLIACDPEVFAELHKYLTERYQDIEVSQMSDNFLKLIRRGRIDDRHFIEDKQVLGLSE